MTYLENLVSVRSIKGTLQDHRAHVELLSDLAVSAGDDDNLRSRRKLAEVRLLLARANADFRAGRYQAALDLYKRLRSIVYGLIQPSFNPDMYKNPNLRLPENPALFKTFMKVSLDMVEKISPSTVYSSFGGSILTLPPEVQKEMGVFSGTGVNAETGIKPEVTEAAQVAADYMAGGEWHKAAEFFRLGLKALDGDGGEEALLAQGAMEMNLGVAMLQAGQADQAASDLKQAEASFARAGDKLGQAQAKINQAAAFSKLGNQGQADELLAAAKKLLAEADSGAAARPRPRPTPITPTRPVIGGPDLRGPRLRTDLSISRPVTRPQTLSVGISEIAVSALAAPFTSKPDVIDAAIEAGGQAVVVRLPGKSDGWAVQELASKIENDTAVKAKTLAVVHAGDRAELTWKADQRIDVEKATDLFYTPTL